MKNENADARDLGGLMRVEINKLSWLERLAKRFGIKTPRDRKTRRFVGSCAASLNRD